MARGFRVAAALLVATLSLQHPAGAQSPADKAAAEELFAQGRALTKEGRHAEACPKFADSQRLDPAVGTELNLARCYEANGQTASAWALFKDVAVAAERAGQPDRSRLARRLAMDLEKHLSRITITFAQPDASGAAPSVRRDGKVVDPAELNAPIPVDPGEHTVVATAPGRQSWSVKVTLAAGALLTVPVPQLAMGSNSSAPADPSSSQATIPSTDSAVVSPSHARSELIDSNRKWRTVGIAVGGVAVLSIGIASILGLVAKGTYDVAHCPTNDTCDNNGLNGTASARSEATASTVLFAVGGAALAGGVVLYLLSAPKSAGAPRAALSIGPGLRGEPRVTLGASW